jgi:phosphoribosylformylglycinamidine synthase
VEIVSRQQSGGPPVLQRDGGSIYYINLSQDDFKLGGSSLAQTLNTIGKMQQLKMLLFKSLQYDAKLILDNQILAGHDIGSGDHKLIRNVFC